MPLDLFSRENTVGIFRGFREGGLEFHADLVLRYRSEFQSRPMHGQFLLVQLENPNEAVLGRITGFSPQGKLASGAGEEFSIRAVYEDRPVPEDLRDQYLRYHVNIRVLGVVRSGNGDANGLTFVPSHRRLPHLGSLVAFPSGDVLRELVGHNAEGAEIGHFALGEYVYAENRDNIEVADWMQLSSPEVLVKFAVSSLVSRRSFIFARAGFGKSNLNKLLFSKLYEKTPKVTKAQDRRVPVGTVIFDPDGEYFWPDDRGRPGLCDVPHLVDKLVVFTSRQSASEYYQSFVAGGIQLDIRRLRPSDVIGIALAPERQQHQNVRKLRGLGHQKWVRMVDLVYKDGNQSDLDEICTIMDLMPDRQEAEALAARANMTAIVRSLHNPASQLMDMLIHSLSEGKLCVVDVSQLRGSQAMILSGLILRRIFDRNQEQFTASEPETIPTIAVIEEAQSVLHEGAVSAEPFIAWVKEGRKYDLGAVLITQQPGSIPVEILSQGDNWFVFHLLAAADLSSLSRANAHLSSDILSALLNEPIPGQGVFWSSGSGKPYPISLRALSFEKLHETQDPSYSSPAADTFALKLRQQFRLGSEGPSPSQSGNAESSESSEQGSDAKGEEADSEPGNSGDVLATVKANAVATVKQNAGLLTRLGGEGAKWVAVQVVIDRSLPKTFQDSWDTAYNILPDVMDAVFGSQPQGWHTFRLGKTLMIKSGPKDE